jgi:ADP-ribose pyrophosphatase YjhB (NUDIX family)
MPDPAPASYVYCPRCGAALETRQVGDKPRRVCPACQFIYFTDPKVGVGTLVVQNGKILLVRRRMRPEVGKWSLPAGFVDRGEDPAMVAVRETQEETGLEVAVERLIDVYFNEEAAEGGASIFILYSVRLLGGRLEAGDDADEAAFFDLDRLPELAFNSTRDAVRWLQEKREQSSAPPSA